MSNGRDETVSQFENNGTSLNLRGLELPHPDLAEVELPAVLFALSDPLRLGIVRNLAANGQLSIAQCQARGADVPKSTFSHHLKTLREAGLIISEQTGRSRMVTLRRDEVDMRFPGLLDAIVSPRD